MATSTADSAEAALAWLDTNVPDLMILDIMMGEMSGFELLRILRERQLMIPVLLLSAKVEDVDKVQGFGLGADDYVTKPFSPVELVARVQAHLRRVAHITPQAAPASLRCGNFFMDMEAQTLNKNYEEIPLSTTETALLYVLMKQPNKVLTKAQLFHAVWQHSRYDDNVLNVYINRIRNKIESNPKKPIHLQTVWGIGYRFVTEELNHEAEG